MRKIDVISDPRSCLNRSTDEEPVFVIRGSDPIAGDVIRDWARRARRAGHREEKCVRAEREAREEFDTWPKKVPD